MKRRRTMSPFLLLLLALPAAAADAPEIGHVVAIEGRATAAVPGQPDRVLGCGDPVHEGERIATGRGARVVIARDGRHAHLGADGGMVLRRDPDGATRTVLLRGSVRLLDAADVPAIRVAGGFGTLSLPSSDVELRRLASGDLRICDWSAEGASACQQIDRSGRIRGAVEEGPRLDLGIRGLCEWEPRDEVAWADFAAAPSVATAPASPSFEPEIDPGEPGCVGDECTPTPSFEPPTEIVYTVEQPGFFDPLAP
jgi:hypothetical protein